MKQRTGPGRILSIASLGVVAFLLMASPAVHADPICSAFPSEFVSPAIDISAPAGIAGLQLVIGSHDNIQFGFSSGPGAFAEPAAQVTPIDPALAGYGIVEVTDLNGMPCRIGVSFKPLGPSVVRDTSICHLPNIPSPQVMPGGNTVQDLEVFVTSEDLTPGGVAECAVNLAPVSADEPDLPLGMVHSCPVPTIRFPVTGDTLDFKFDLESMPAGLDGTWMLVSPKDGPPETPFGPFMEITTGRTMGCSDLLLGKGNCVIPPDATLPQVKIACGLFQPDCNDALVANADQDLDGDTVCDQVGPLGVIQDCNDTNIEINSTFSSTYDELRCNGLDDNCDGVVDDIDFDLDGFFADCPSAVTELDCDDNDPLVWNIREIGDLLLSYDSVLDEVTLSWTADDCIGGSEAVGFEVSLMYDTVRSVSALDFSGAACVNANDAATNTVDSSPTGPGLEFYLVVAQHDTDPSPTVMLGCSQPGEDSAGTPRTAVDCF